MARCAPILAAAVILLTACAPSTGPRSVAQPGANLAGTAQEPRKMNVGLEREPSTLGLRPLRETFASAYFPNRTFNADFAFLDDLGTPQPYLVDALPRLNSDTWRVFPDGQMETTYRLRPNLAWHDGTALSAEDYVFGWHVYSAPDTDVSWNMPMWELQ
jgi:ABC-type transport system substrate-binding protein